MLKTPDPSATIKVIRRYHAIGRSSLKDLPERGRYGDQSLEDAAKDLGTGWSYSKLRKARQFADPEKGYSDERLDRLCALLERHQPIFGTSHVGILVTVSWGDGRAELQRLCIKDGWSTSRLMFEIKMRLGRRKTEVGRRRLVADERQAVIQLADFAETWRRWRKAVDVASDDHGSRSILKRLPRKVIDQVEVISDAFARLQESVVEQLSSWREE